MSLPSAVSRLRCRSRSHRRRWDDHEDKDHYGLIGKSSTETTAEVTINDGRSKAENERSFEELGTFVGTDWTFLRLFPSKTLQVDTDNYVISLVTRYVDKIPSCNMLCWNRVQIDHGFVPVPARICVVWKVPSEAMIDDLGFLRGGTFRAVPTTELVRYSGCSQKKRWCPKLMNEYLEYIRSRYDAEAVQVEEAFLKRILQDVKAKEQHEESDSDTVQSSRSKFYNVQSSKQVMSVYAEARDDGALGKTACRHEPRQEIERQAIPVDNHGLDSTTWWEVNPQQSKRGGATPLVNRCIRAYGWSELFALRVLEGYKQFLTWKKSFEDWDGSTLSPSLPIKMMWQQHLLDSHNYQSDCMLLFGNLMHYDPDDGIEPEAESERIENTRRLASMRYREGDLDEQVWHWEEKKLEKPSHISFVVASSSSNSDLQSIDEKDLICLRIIGGFKKGLRSATIAMESSDDFQTIFEEYASEYAMRVGKLVSLRFLTKNGQRIADTDTPRKLGLTNNDEILVVQMSNVLQTRTLPENWG